MAKKKPAHKKSKVWYKQRKHQRQAAIVILCLLVLGSFLIFLHGKSSRQQAENIRNIKATADIRVIAQTIISSVGQPLAQRNNNQCSGAGSSQECSFKYYLVYGVSDETQATDLMDGVSQASRSKLNIWAPVHKSSSLSPFHPLFQGNDIAQVFGEDFLDTKTDMKCTVQYDFYPSTYDLPGYPHFAVATLGILLVEVGCSNSA